MTHSSEGLPAREKTKVEVLQEDFCSIFGEDRKSDTIKLFKKITKGYQAKNRGYHNFEHIENLLSFLNERKQEIRDLSGVRLAAWFHDVVYNTKDNEEKSAQCAQNCLEQLSTPTEIIAHAVSLIRATAKHESIENDSDSAIFLDADLAILGASEKNYDKYAIKIRKEYALVSDETYKTGRIKVLKSFLERPRIYLTEKVGKELEQQARKNIEREITRLS
jgi:predicted metal-dependent HD superfamily phosphohydrolase